jgi:hypothetical protein
VWITVVAALSALIASCTVQFLAPINNLEKKLADIRMAAMEVPKPPSDQIIVVAIDEETLEQFAYRSPIDREFIANLIEKIDAGKPKAIGVDVLIDQASEPTKDSRLYLLALGELGLALVVELHKARTDLPQGVDRFLVRRRKQALGPLAKLTRSGRAQHDEGETILNVFQTIFDGDACHDFLLCMNFVSYISDLAQNRRLPPEGQDNCPDRLFLSTGLAPW